MSKEENQYETILKDKVHAREQLRRFAGQLAAVEKSMDLKPRKVLVNGIPVDDVFTASYALADLGNISKLLEAYLSVPRLDPDIIINGIPGRPYDLKVTVDLNRR